MNDNDILSDYGSCITPRHRHEIMSVVSTVAISMNIKLAVSEVMVVGQFTKFSRWEPL
jgi:hypothetical protein